MLHTRLATLVAAALVAACAGSEPAADILVLHGTVYDGSGSEGVTSDVAIKDGRILFVGEAGDAGVEAIDTVDATGLIVTPGFVDMHSHAALDEDYGRDGLPFLYQGITTVVLGVDGAGRSEVTERFASWTSGGIGVNAMTYVGHNAARRAVIGMEDRPPTDAELEEMRAFVRRGMEEGALGLSSGLFYLPGNYAETEEVIELNKVAAAFEGAIYDTHDRDLGAAYPSFGYLNSIREGIRIGEEGGTKVIFSHFNAQGAQNYGRAPEGAALIDEARARGIEVAAAQHVYTATQSNLRSYTIPGWAVAGGDTAMARRFDDPDTVRMIDRQSREMLAIRGGGGKLLFADPRPELNGRTLADKAEEWGIPESEASRRILREGNATVMNLDLYDAVNTEYLAQQPWMMTVTDGRSPPPGADVTHPRVYGAFTKKLRDLVLDRDVISLSFAVRSMTGLAADFLGWTDRGYVREGQYADLSVFDLDRVWDRATFAEPHQYSEGSVHVLVNGTFAMRDGQPTRAMAGRPIKRRGEVFSGS
jgi:N-acyl-D-amino-acid deacylase